MSTEENPAYITVSYVLDTYHINKMVWDTRADDYVVYSSQQEDDKAEALLKAWIWARREGIEFRK